MSEREGRGGREGERERKKERWCLELLACDFIIENRRLFTFPFSLQIQIRQLEVEREKLRTLTITQSAEMERAKREYALKVVNILL
jgi:hypothetical protein